MPNLSRPLLEYSTNGRMDRDLMALILHASTTRHVEWGGSKRYIRIIVHDTIDDFRKKAKAHSPDMDWSEAVGAFQPAPDLEDFDDQGYRLYLTPIHWTGVLRLSREWLNVEVVTHECFHAATTIYRMDVKTIIMLGKGCRDREETLAYIIGDLTAAVFDALHLGKVW